MLHFCPALTRQTLCLGHCATGAQSGTAGGSYGVTLFSLIWVKVSFPVIVLGQRSCPSSLLASLEDTAWLLRSAFSNIALPVWSFCPPLEQKHTAVSSLEGHMNKICKAIGASARKILLTAPCGALTSLTWFCLLGTNNCVQADLRVQSQ